MLVRRANFVILYQYGFKIIINNNELLLLLLIRIIINHL